jgi:hypothetical protein
MQTGAQTVRQRLGDHDIGESAYQGRIADKVHPAVILSASGQFARRFFRRPFHQHTLNAAHHGATDGRGLFVDQRLQLLQPLLLDLTWYRIIQRRRRRARARTVDETE